MTMERRTSLRRPITLVAKLTLTGEQYWPCEIADFCAEGLFIKYDDDVSLSVREAVQKSPDLKVKVLFLEPKTNFREHQYLLKWEFQNATKTLASGFIKKEKFIFFLRFLPLNSDTSLIQKKQLIPI